MESVTMTELLQEEEKSLSEINEEIQMKKTSMNSDEPDS